MSKGRRVIYVTVGRAQVTRSRWCERRIVAYVTVPLGKGQLGEGRCKKYILSWVLSGEEGKGSDEGGPLNRGSNHKQRDSLKKV